MTMRLLTGDCRDVLKTLPACSVDAIVTDPPYHLTANKKGGTGVASVNLDTPHGRARIGTGNGLGGFMGMSWDGGDVAFQPATWAAALRVLKPGGYLVAFGGTRTYHRLVCAIEDAGFEVRDTLAWLYGSGFPKSTDKAKIPAAWQGWNTALKPAHEPICLARKAMDGTLAENLAKWGTGALWVDGCRIGTDEDLNGEAYSEHAQQRTGAWVETRRGDTNSMRNGGAGEYAQPAGRWPANVLHDGSDEVLALFPASNSTRASGNPNEPRRGANHTATSYGQGDDTPTHDHRDTGSAARFFYCAKASRAERNEGLPSSGKSAVGTGATMRQCEDADWAARNGNNHPTVKPLALMRWLIRLVTPPGGTLVDPFVGSGTTLKAAELDGYQAIGIELDPAHTEIARRRIGADAPLFAATANQESTA